MSAVLPALLPSLVRQVGGALLLGVLLALIGPFGTFRELSTVDRFTYWIVIAGLNWLQISGMVELLARWPRTSRLHAFGMGALAGVIAAVPASFEVAWLEQYFRPGTTTPQHLPVLYLQVALLSIAVAGPVNMFKRRRGAATATATAEAASTEATAQPATTEIGTTRPVSFLRRVPPSLGSNLLALEMEDHYLRIHTDRGSDLILCRFADALANWMTIWGCACTGHGGWPGRRSKPLAAAKTAS